MFPPYNAKPTRTVLLFRPYIWTLVAFAFVHLSHGFWIINHNQLTIDRLDPIVSPGEVSTHVHTIIGASNFAPEVEQEKLMESECTTSPVQEDKSSYWAPQLYIKNDNGTFTLVPIQYVNTYC